MATTTLTKIQKDILNHSLGLHAALKPYRNYGYDKITPELKDLLDKGFIKQYESFVMPRDLIYYFVTFKGMQVLLGDEYCKENKHRLNQLLR